jgi:predicted nucleotidyltransferase
MCHTAGQKLYMFRVQNNGHMPEKLDFITPTFLKILYLFHEDPMQDLHEREVVRRTRVSKGSANKILRKLSEVNILERNRKGRMVFYRLNSRNAVAKQFKILFSIYALNELTESIKSECKKIMLFGSCSEGTDIKESDIDVFILTNEKDKIRPKLDVYQKDIEKRISPVIVNSNEFAKLRKEDKPFYDRIMKGITLWESE